MAIEKSVKEEYLNSLTQNYMDKLFYFCLKKTGNSFEAENLTSDILLNIITSLERGNKPENFEAWVWGITRNRYSVWAKNKHNQSEMLVNLDKFLLIFSKASIFDNIVQILGNYSD